MADAQYGVEKVHGFVITGIESLSSNFEYITIAMTTDITPYDPTATPPTGTPDSQACLDKLIQIISERGQPVIMGDVVANELKVVIEHPHAWQCVEGVAGWQLIDRIKDDGINYGLVASSVTFSDVLA
jgi:hypothetical protein